MGETLRLACERHSKETLSLYEEQQVLVKKYNALVADRQKGKITPFKANKQKNLYLSIANIDKKLDSMLYA